MAARQLGSEGLVRDNGQDPEFGTSSSSCYSTRKVADN
jgi:translocator assembly and maintenance protein 41